MKNLILGRRAQKIMTRIILGLALLLLFTQGCTGGLNSNSDNSIDPGQQNSPPPTTPGTPTTTTTLPGGTPNPPITQTDYFPSDSVWYRDVSAAAVDSESTTIINWLAANGGWGLGRMQVDFSFNVLQMDASTPRYPIVDHPDGYYAPDCADNLGTFPLPAGGAIEGESGYTCTSDGDCHILVVDKANRKLYEAYRGNLSGGRLQTMCAIVWDLRKTYGPLGRGDQCTSTDAAGFPVAPLLFTADEIAAGEIKHAIRFIMPNPRMRRGVFVRPATHAGGPSGPAQAIPYGARLRLKSTFDLSRLKPSARVVARAMQKYGMLLADGGNVALTAANDRYTTAKWSQVDFSAQDLSALQVTDFEMIEAGARITNTYDCVRTND